MDNPPLQTAQMHHLLQRIRDGDRSARDELIRSVCARLEALARKMLRRFPNVHRWAETDDVLQSALVRLLRGLETLQPPSMRDFFTFAAAQMRWELLDLARHFAVRGGQQTYHASGLPEHTSINPTAEPSAPAEDPAEMEKWCRLHEEVEKLPVEEREVFSLIYYHGWEQVAVAELFQISDRTVRRRWESALVFLHKVLEDVD